jgi:mono/diheme cytochrome c family protein
VERRLKAAVCKAFGKMGQDYEQTAMKSMPWILMLLLRGVADAAASAKFDRGQAFYKNHCQHCHTANIHSRANRLPLTRE